MKIYNKKKRGQSLLEFALIAALVGIVGGWAFIKMNPDLFRNYFKSSVSSTNTIDSNGQMKICTYDDNNCATPVAPPAPPPPPNTCDPIVIGAVEADGSIYAGTDGINNLCVTASDDSAGTTWNNGGSFYIGTGATNQIMGLPNTTLLDTLIDGANPYQAAELCANLNRHGQTDWYLPAQVELSIIYVNSVAIGGFASEHYWSSTEFDADQAYVVDFPNLGQIQGKDKDDSYPVRCVRHD